MIEYEEVLKINDILIDRFGGTKGIQNKEALSSAVSRPYATFDQKELYPSSVEKAAAILESIVTNHPFIDGNKRTGYVLMRLFLMQDHKDIRDDENKKYHFVMSISKGELNIDEITAWIHDHLVKR